ncbi:MAG: long-chain-acyl-CoA synthetase [Steroidobacteraceae bacterium]|jgi:fatty-acyl-CoA synthase
MQTTDPNSKFARQAWLRALERTAAIDRNPDVTLPVLVERWAERSEAAPALVSPEASLTYRELAVRSHQYARWGLARGLKSGDVVCLIMPNCPEYLAVWLGLTRLGVAVALANTHLAGDALAHCINIIAPKQIIVGAEHAATLAAVRDRLSANATCWFYGNASQDMARLEPVLASLAGEALPPQECALPTLDSTALFIYTSGTTGLPKAAKVSHYRLMQWSHWFAGMLDTQASDRMYNCLPLYHSVGGVVATGATLVGGGAVEIRARFSASDFWRDVTESRATMFQYIGELCRYLVNAPPHPDETRHCLRIACGNGLRPEVWEPFQSRFRIPRILEYYASTEGNFSLYNCEGQPGAIGRIPPFLAARLPVALLRFDTDTAEPLRNAAGLCEACDVNEVGEAVGLIPAADRQRGGRFEGYADPVATERKLLRNVFESGDAWYRTGDLMRRDEKGFFYFVDRVGETYRWKGENVSTAEVLSALASVPGVLEGVVYGVQVPGTDGRAGMAALVVGDGFDIVAFRAAVVERLPVYARPVFLRLLRSLDATGTFKPKKQDLVLAGFDPSKISDPLYVDDALSRAYQPIDAARHAGLIGGKLRL